jgi:hypothetical protein
MVKDIMRIRRRTIVFGSRIQPSKFIVRKDEESLYWANNTILHAGGKMKWITAAICTQTTQKKVLV